MQTFKLPCVAGPLSLSFSLLGDLINLIAILFLAMKRTISMAGGRGGDKHKPVRPVDEGVLMEIFAAHKENMCDLGVYEGISRPQASFAPGIAANAALLKRILVACPQAELPTAVARSAFMRVLMQFPGLNKSIYTMDVYAGLRVDRLCVMLYHLRRFDASRDTNEEAMRVACKKCTAEQLLQLKNLKALMNLTGFDADQTCAETVFHDPLEPATPIRSLKKELSLDDDGYPCLLTAPSSRYRIRIKSPDPAGSSVASQLQQESPAQAQLCPNSDPRQSQSSVPGSLNPEALGYVPVPKSPAAAKAEAGVKAAAKAKAKAKAKAAAHSNGSVASKPKAKAKAAAQSHSSGPVDCQFMFYKKDNSMGIRVKGGNQIFSFGIGSNNLVTKERFIALERLAKLCVIKLLEGQDVEEVKTWARQKALPIRSL